MVFAFRAAMDKAKRGAHVFIQGELSTREYQRSIAIPNGKKSIKHVIRQLVVELKAIRSAFSTAPPTPS